MSSQEIDTTYSDLILMVGGQILLLFILIMITVFGVKSISEPLRTLTGNINTALPSVRGNK
jgi:hypothetical protein